ncbi:MAG TPA: hypothetical protein VG754_01170 [Verrucomicrobiae bacterium]|jgi:hypothetical protein|nr:hypothetical protein [Verrucomicrobiae bacterium]
MEFLKKNYEKVLLAVVLLGLTIAACLLPFVISSKRAAMENMVSQRIPHPKPLPPLDMTLEDAALQREQTAFALDFTTKHNLFNPVIWKRIAGGGLLKESTGNEEGAAALEVTNIKALYLELKFGSPSASGYMIDITRQGAPREDLRHKSSYISKESKTDLLTLLEVKGDTNKPSELVLEWNESGEMKGDTISIGPDKPFRKIEAYSADLKYPPEKREWTDRRVGFRFSIANAYYKIVAITPTNVVVLAESNNKKTTITFHPATEPR